MSATVTVRGTSSARAKPDEARLTLILSALRDRADEAHADVAERSRRLAAVLGESEIPESDRLTTGITVRESREWMGGTYVHRGYLAATSVDVRLTDVEVLGRLMTAAIMDADAEVHGPEWRVLAENPAHDDARAAAIADARRRADAYAAGLGARVGAVAEVREPGATHGTAYLQSASMVADSAPPELHVEAGEAEVACVIEVVYRLEQ